MTPGPTLERPRRRVDIAIATQQLSRDRIDGEQLLFVGCFEIDLGLHPAICVAVNHDLRSAIAAIGRGGVKDTVLEEECVARVESEIFDFDVNRIDMSFAD